METENFHMSALDLEKKEAEVSTMQAPESKIESPEKELTTREVLLKVADNFLVDGFNEREFAELNNEQLGEKLQQKFQESLLAHFKESGLADEVRILALRESTKPSGIPLDEQVLHLIAERSRGVSGWADILPKLRREYKGAGLNCTLASAMLHIALEETGFANVRTVSTKGHHIVLRELPDGSLKLYGPTDITTTDERLTGYVRTFTPAEIYSRQPVEEGHERSGYALRLALAESDELGGFIQPDAEGHYTKSYYAYDPSIKMDVGVALENLSEIKADAEGKVSDPDHLLLNEEAYKESVVAFLVKNNSSEISEMDIQMIAKENRPANEKFMQAAKAAFLQEGEPPNPFDFLKHPLLRWKAEVAIVPDPKDFVDKERYEQAKELCKKYPELKQLDLDEEKFQLQLFDGHAYL